MRSVLLGFWPLFGALADTIGRDVASFSTFQLDMDLGAPYGLSPATMDEDGIAPTTVASVRLGAQKRNPESLYFLGLLRLYGHGGLGEDHAVGLGHIREAAELGHVQSQSALGMLLLSGVGLEGGASAVSEKEEKEAMSWIRRAAISDNRDAQWMLGKHLLEAEVRKSATLGVPGRYAEAAAFLRKAAAQDSKEAFYHLALMHEYGRGVPLDLPEAARLYRKSASQGYVAAMYNLGLMVSQGPKEPSSSLGRPLVLAWPKAVSRRCS